MNHRSSHKQHIDQSLDVPEQIALLEQNKLNDIKMSTRQGRILCFKYFIYGFSLLFIVVGFGLLALGTWLKCDARFRDFLSEEYRQVVKESWWDAPTLYIGTYCIIVLGAVMIVIAFFGCCGAINENQCILVTYFVFLMLLFVGTLGSGIFLFARRDQVDNEVADALTYMVQNYYQGAGIVQETMDNIQTTFRCCGNSGCGDYRELRIDIPRSCDLRCDSCRFRVYKALRIGFTIVSVIFLIVLVAQFIALIMSFLLCCWIRGIAKEMEYRYYAAPTPMNTTPMTASTPMPSKPLGPPKVTVKQVDSRNNEAYNVKAAHNYSNPQAYSRPAPQPVVTRNVQQANPNYSNQGYREYAHENERRLPEQYFGQPPPGYSTRDRRMY